MTGHRFRAAALATALCAVALVGCGGAGPDQGPLPRSDRSAAASAPPTDAGRPSTGTPPAGRAAAAPPERIVVPAIGVDAPVVPVGLEANGAMEVPDAGHAAWYTEGPVPGDPGPAVVLAHVSTRRAPDVFWKLHELVRGDLVTLVGTDGSRRTWAVTRTEQTPKDRLPVERIWNRTREAELRLITCAGSVDPRTGHYLDNLVVYARPVPPKA